MEWRDELLQATTADPQLAEIEVQSEELPEHAVRRFGTTKLRHYRARVALSPDGEFLVSASELGGGAVRFWRVRDGKELPGLLGKRSGAVRCLAFSHDGRLLVLGLGEGLQLWDAATRRNLYYLKGVGDTTDVVFAPDGKTFATLHQSERAVRLWRTSDGEMLAQWNSETNGDDFAPFSIAISPNDARLAVGTEHGDILFLVSPMPVRIENAHGIPVAGLVFSPDGTKLFSASAQPEGLQQDEKHAALEGLLDDEQKAALVSEIRVWNGLDGSEIGKMESPDKLFGLPKLAMSADGRHLFSSHVRRIAVWDIATRSVVRQIPKRGDYFTPSPLVASKHNIIASAGIHGTPSAIYLWDAATGEFIHQVGDSHTGEVTSTALSRDGKTFVTGGGDGTVRIWDAVSGNLNRTLDFATGMVQSVGISPDQSRVIAVGDLLSGGGLVRAWDFTTGQPVFSTTFDRECRLLAFSPDGKMFAVRKYHLSPSTIEILRTDSGETVKSLAGHENQIVAMRYSNDGTQVASLSTDLVVRVWNVTTGQREREVLLGPDRKPNLMSAAFTSDLKRAITGRAERLDLWDLSSGKEIRSFPQVPIPVKAIAVSPDEQVIATSCSMFQGDEDSATKDKAIDLWSLTSGDHLLKLDTKVDGNPWALSMSHDGRHLLTGFYRSTAMIWDLSEAYRQLEK